MAVRSAYFWRKHQKGIVIRVAVYERNLVTFPATVYEAAKTRVTTLSIMHSHNCDFDGDSDVLQTGLFSLSQRVRS